MPQVRELLALGVPKAKIGKKIGYTPRAINYHLTREKQQAEQEGDAA